MASNPYVNKVVFGAVSIIDISDTTATASDVAQGKYFYAASGEKLEGTATGGGQFTGTITKTGLSQTAYVSYNDTKYYTLDDYFNYSAGDTLYMYLGDAYNVIMEVNGVVVASNSDQSTRVSLEYLYTLPSSDIKISITAANRNIRRIEIFTSPYLVEKTISENGTYNASSDNADGYSSVTVNVSGGGGGAISVVDTLDSHGGTIRTITAVDISDTTAVASDVASGKYFYTADGTKTAGTASGGGGGLEYETGTWTPSADVTSDTILFANTHTEPPFYYMVADADTTTITDGRTATSIIYSNNGQVFGGGAPLSSSTYYGSAYYGYTDNNTPPSTYTGTSAGQIVTPYNDSSSSGSYNSRYWATETSIKIYNGRTWRAGRTYKWIAVWAPTT